MPESHSGQTTYPDLGREGVASIPSSSQLVNRKQTVNWRNIRPIIPMNSVLRRLFANLHYAGTALLAILAVPAIRHLHLPMHINWGRMLVFYWVSLGSRSVPYALAFCLLTFPVGRTVVPFLERYKKAKLRGALTLAFLILLCVRLSFATALLLTIDAVFLIELAERARGQSVPFHRKLGWVAISAAYLFVGITLVLIYNDIIIAIRFPVSYDSLFNRIDMRILNGRGISGIAHAIFSVAPRSLLSFLDFAYFQMFLVVGAAFLISAYGSFRRGLQFAGTCLTAYYLALLVFYIWPTYGPYIFCVGHLERYPTYLTTYAFQEAGITGLRAITQGQSQTLGSGYYIAFPSLHIALPVIAMWFLRDWRVMFRLLLAYNLVICAAILILEWHYAVDLPGGIAVGALALAMVGPDETSSLKQN